MISVVHNKTQNAIQVFLDKNGADLLIKKLQDLKSRPHLDHLHLYATNDDTGISTNSPYREQLVFGELILQMLPSEAWDDL